jgi:SAM-dependent methyltransferase
MPNRQGYEFHEFPALYDVQHSGYQEDLPFWKDLAQRYGTPFLELGCGSGRVLLALEQNGFRGVGLDRDIEMLKFLRGKREADVFCADMTAFRLAGLFRLVILPCNTYSTLDTPERRKVLKMVKRHLQPQGAFAVCLPNPRLLRLLPEVAETEVEEIIAHPVDGLPVQISTSWVRNESVLQIFWHYDHLFPDGRVTRLTVEQAHQLNPAELYEEEFTEEGFAVVGCYGDFSMKPFERYSAYLIYVLELLAVV